MPPSLHSGYRRVVPPPHKGDHDGRLLIIGGDHGTAGAIRMTGEAALRGGGLIREC